MGISRRAHVKSRGNRKTSCLISRRHLKANVSLDSRLRFRQIVPSFLRRPRRFFWRNNRELAIKFPLCIEAAAVGAILLMYPSQAMHCQISCMPGPAAHWVYSHVLPQRQALQVALLDPTARRRALVASEACTIRPEGVRSVLRSQMSLRFLRCSRARQSS